MIAALGAQLGFKLEPCRFTIADGATVEVDGYSADPPVLVEAWAHQGPPKGGQRNKVLADALKLQLVAASLDPRPRRLLCFADDAAARPFIHPSRTWYAQALRDTGVEVVVIDLAVDLRAEIREAQVRQYR